MSLAKNKLIKDILSKSTIFVCGEEESLSRHSLHLILNLTIKFPLEHLYFINPNKTTLDILHEESFEKHYTIITNIGEINDFYKYNIISCGIPVNSIEFLNHAKENTNSKLLFFPQLGLLNKMWGGIDAKTIIQEQKLGEFINDIEPPKPNYTETLQKSSNQDTTTFFTNRGRALDQYREFARDINKRSAIIIGIKGIGKRAFINKLKTIGLIKIVTHYCIKSVDDLSYILLNLLGRYSVEYRDSEIPTYLEHSKVDPLLKKLFAAIDREPNSNLIIYNVHVLYNKEKGVFYDPNIPIFFKHLLNRPSYRGNKIYFTCEYSFEFPNIQSEIFQIIKLNTMTAEYIKYILEYEFSKPERQSIAYATEITQFSDKVIDQLIGGFPPIAHIFVDICGEYPMDEIINRGFAYSIFKEKKIKELAQFISLDETEIKVVAYLSLFNKPVPIEAIQYFDPQALPIVEFLVTRLLIEKEEYDNQTLYYVQSIVQDYVLSIVNPDITKTNHNKIADYYWNSAENKPVGQFDIIEEYRLALAHYAESANFSKQNLLVTKFSGIFQNIAYEYYQANHMEDAYKYYAILYEQGLLTNEKHLNHFLVCCAKLQITNTKELFQIATTNHPNNVFIQISFANYLYTQEDYINAKSVCDIAKEIDSSNYVINNLYAKILNKTGEQSKAIAILEKEIKGFQNKSDRTNADTQALIAYLMTYFTILDYYSHYGDTKLKVTKYLLSDGMTKTEIDKMLNKPFSKEIETKIINLFDKAANHKLANKLLYFSYSNFLKQQGKHANADKMLERGRKVDYAYFYKSDADKQFELSFEIEDTNELEILSYYYNTKINENSQNKSNQIFEESSLNKSDKFTNEPNIFPQQNSKELSLPKLNISTNSDKKIPIEKSNSEKKQNNQLINATYRESVSSEISFCNKLSLQALSLLDQILAIEPNNYRALATKTICTLSIETLKTIENEANIYYTKLIANNIIVDSAPNSQYLAGSRISAELKGLEVIKRLDEMNLDLENCGFLNLGGGDGTELLTEIYKSKANYGLLLEYDFQSVKQFISNQLTYKSSNPARNVQTEVIECDLGDKKKFEVAKQLIKNSNIKCLVVTIHAVLHELNTRSYFKPFDYYSFFKRIYDLHENIIIFIREPGIPENWNTKVKLTLKNEYVNEFISILKRVNEIHFNNNSTNFEIFDTYEIVCDPHLAIEALTNFFYKEDFDYEKDEKHTSINKRDLVSFLEASRFEILESESFYTNSMKKNLKHYDVKVSGLNGEHISLPQCFTYTVAKKGNLFFNE